MGCHYVAKAIYRCHSVAVQFLAKDAIKQMKCLYMYIAATALLKLSINLSN